MIVVGGGAIGLNVALELASRGCEVQLLDRGTIGDSASRVAAGILPPANLQSATDPIDQLRGLSHGLFPSLAERLANLSSIDIGLRRCGGYYLGTTPGEIAVMTGMVQYWENLNIQCERVSIDHLRKREPRICPWFAKQSDSNDTAAWWVPDEYQIRTPDYLRALQIACQKTGVAIGEHTAVDRLRTTKTGAAVSCENRWFEADRVVLCGGSWSGLLSPELRLERSLIPIRGQILVLKTDHPLLRSIVNVGNRYVLCRDDGHTIIGSCEEETGFVCETTDGMIDALHRFAVGMLPELESAMVVERCAGLRPLTFDGFPMIGKVPDISNVYIAAGHYRSGIHLSPATAVCLADVMMGQTPQVDLEPFRVGKQQFAS
ncbi:Glycine oxidase [Planctomycetes bacterium CA13]|uniref:Glycine oxidase n=1 Tax=Novipirellula herctigrandis TaxID=2527986 RepID=A0A5C5YNZ4_9BACT|nr:Glycine oxidase [Planctomycetes bacterium CA13]